MVMYKLLILCFAGFGIMASSLSYAKDAVCPCSAAFLSYKENLSREPYKSVVENTITYALCISEDKQDLAYKFTLIKGIDYGNNSVLGYG